MALTAAQEAVLLQLIEAFQNGKRLSDLPEVKDANPYKLMVEVLDTDGESKKAKLAAFLPYLEEQCAYGIERDTAVSTPTCTRIGNSDLHRTLPIQSRMRGVLLNDDGKIVEYLDPKDWTGHDRSGVRGQVMVEIPSHYRRFITDGTKQQVLLSEYPLPGYEYVPLCYVSAYEASMQRSNSMLSSVVNSSTDFRGGFNQSSFDGTPKTLLGRPATSINRTNFRTSARKRKPSTTEWNCMTYDVQKTLYWLFVVEYATLNTQAAYNAELTTQGYRQGGLGAGVTTLDSKWNAWNNYNPFIPCGYTDHLGNRTGIVAYELPTEYSAIVETVSVPRYRGIENPFGHIWQWTDGINVCISPTEANGGNNLSKVFVCHEPSKFKDNNYDGYHHIGNAARNNGYIKEILFGEEGDIIPSTSTGGGSSTYFCDYHYTTISASETIRGAMFGGDSGCLANAGLACADLSRTASISYAFAGTRLCFIPE